MNERIRQLALQAGAVNVWEWASDDVLDTKNMDAKKFAELIVKECASMARVFQSNEYDFTGDLDLDEFMLKHFGVEE
jgi:hypothetical protein